MARKAAVKPYSKGRGSHKPDCKCPPCQARSGAKAAHTGPTGELEVIKTLDRTVVNADLPPIYGQSFKARARIAEWVAIRAANPHLTTKEIAEQMGMTYVALQSVIRRATKEGWLQFDDPMSQLEYEVVPKVLDNLNKLLEAGDKTATLETAKGTVFKRYQAEHGAGEGQQNLLALKIEMVPAAIDSTKMDVAVGQIVGVAKHVD